jgi:CubicO group peptidase (beta-lactamase class C family)
MNKCFIFLYIITCTISFAQEIKVQEVNLNRALAQKLITTDGIPPGISIAISHNGHIVFAEGFGYANLKNKTPVTPVTQFRAASVSKMMTITALARLIQENRVDLDASIQKYIPEFPKKAFPISARQLAGHLAGIPHYSSGDSIKSRFYNSVDEALEVFSHLELLHEPETKYSYSTHGYTLLSGIIEGASGQPYLEYIKEAIFQPLGMDSSGPDLRANPSATMTELYNINNEGIASKIENPEDPSYKWGGGGMISTPTDLCRMAEAYINGFFRPDVVEKMCSSQKLQSGQETGIGIGWRISRDMDGRRVIEHAGGMGGARSVITLFPDEKLAIAIMANGPQPWRIEETAHMVALPFLSMPSPVPQPKGNAKVSISLNESNGKESKIEAQLVLNGETDRLIIDPEGCEEQIFSLIYLGRKNIYATVHPIGILHTTITIDNGVIRGKIMSYGSPNLTPPVNEEPFITFEGFWNE